MRCFKLFFILAGVLSSTTFSMYSETDSKFSVEDNIINIPGWGSARINVINEHLDGDQSPTLNNLEVCIGELTYSLRETLQNPGFEIFDVGYSKKDLIIEAAKTLLLYLKDAEVNLQELDLKNMTDYIIFSAMETKAEAIKKDQAEDFLNKLVGMIAENDTRYASFAAHLLEDQHYCPCFPEIKEFIENGLKTEESWAVDSNPFVKNYKSLTKKDL